MWYLKFLFAFYKKSLSVSDYIYYITFEKCFTVHLITHVINKYHR